MALTPEDIDFIEDLKRDLGIDSKLGSSLSRLTVARGQNIGVQPISVAEGQNLSTETFNPAIRRIIEQEDGGAPAAPAGSARPSRG